MVNNATYFALLEACEQPGCPVCRLEQQEVKRFLEHFFYESVNDSGMRSHLRASQGFCREHVELLLQGSLSDALGMSIIYNDVLGTMLKRIKRKDSPSGESTLLSRLIGRAPSELTTTLQRVRQAISPHETCPACQQKESTAHMALAVLTEQIQDEEMLTAFTRSEGLCLPHLRQVFRQAQDGTALAALLKIEMEKLENLQAELAEFIRKNDYRYLKDGFGSEGNAWRRAAKLVAGR